MAPLSGPAQVGLAVGASAPSFNARNSHGQHISLGALQGAPAAVVFYPWAFSGLCRGELLGLRDAHDGFVDRGATVLAISCDAMFTQRAFGDGERFAFEMLSDHWPHGAIARAYGVFDEQNGCALRASFVLDASGVVCYTQVNGLGEPRDLAGLLAHIDALETSG